MPQHHAAVFQNPNDQRIGIEHQLSLKIWNLTGELPPAIYRHYKLDAIVLTNTLVVLAETWSHMHNARTVFGGDKIAGQHTKRISMICEIRKQRRVAHANKRRTHHGFENNCTFELFGISLQPGLRNDIYLSFMRYANVFDVGRNS